MRRRIPVAALVIGAAAAGMAPAAPVAAQVIDGVALDVAGNPLAGVPVALHRVGGMGGASVAAAAADEQGRFRFEIQAADTAVYFVAMRHADRMYVGPPLRGGGGDIRDYVIRADPASEAGAVASALSGGPPAATRSPPGGGPVSGGGAALGLVALLALAVAATFAVTAPGYRARRRREQLLELVSIEGRIADPAFASDRAHLGRRREFLMERLAPED